MVCQKILIKACIRSMEFRGKALAIDGLRFCYFFYFCELVSGRAFVKVCEFQIEKLIPMKNFNLW